MNGVPVVRARSIMLNRAGFRKKYKELDDGRYVSRDFYIPTTKELGIYCKEKHQA